MPIGSSGTVDQIVGDQFVVLLDAGAWFFWTSFAKWEPTGEPDVELSAACKTVRDNDADEYESFIDEALRERSSSTVTSSLDALLCQRHKWSSMGRQS